MWRDLDLGLGGESCGHVRKPLSVGKPLQKQAAVSPHAGVRQCLCVCSSSSLGQSRRLIVLN